jgi:hypothetical protein
MQDVRMLTNEEVLVVSGGYVSGSGGGGGTSKGNDPRLLQVMLWALSNAIRP